MYLPLNAQLKVDAGNDIIVCSGGDGAYKIGGCPVASGGIKPYTYTWSGQRKRFHASNYWLYASDILDDTTKSNPSFLWSAVPEDWFTFYLKVEDAEGSVGHDSVKIRRSYFTINLVDARHVTIKQGDSVALHGNWYFDSNFLPFDFYITPSYGLSDSMDIFGWAKPDTSILYYLYVVNSAGCVSEKVRYLRVDVDTTTVLTNAVVKSEVKCNLVQGNIIVHWPFGNNLPFKLTVATLGGQLIHTGKYNVSNLRLSHLGLKSNQLYIISIMDKHERFIFKLFNV